jgi:hypothetical protein
MHWNITTPQAATNVRAHNQVGTEVSTSSSSAAFHAGMLLEAIGVGIETDGKEGAASGMAECNPFPEIVDVRNGSDIETRRTVGTEFLIVGADLKATVAVGPERCPIGLEIKGVTGTDSRDVFGG